MAAMAMVESGYGWTRAALAANNFYGWKFYSSTAAGGRKSYVLDCQPAADVNNRYVVFASAADAVDFVAYKLANLPTYSKSAAKYREARVSGMLVESATKAWVAGIASPYNWQPTQYIRTVTRMMNDPVAPSDQVSTERNLYRLSNTRGSLDSKTEALARYFASKIESRKCEQEKLDFPRWQGFPVRLCEYREGSVLVKTYMRPGWPGHP